MKTKETLTQLQETCAKLSMYTYENIPKEWTNPQKLKGNVYDYSGRIDNKYTLPSEILDKYTHGLFWDCGKQFKNDNPTEVELYIIRHSTILFLSPNGNLIRLMEHKKKYYFSLDYTHYRDVMHLSSRTKELALQASGIVEPNYIGVFTDKKINEWFKYCDDIAELHKKMISESAEENKKIENKIQEFIDSVKCDVHKWSDKVEVKTKHFVVTFTHEKSTQYLYHKISFNGTLQDIPEIENKSK
jgi:hypothetical protein